MLSLINTLSAGVSAAFREKPFRVAAILCGFLVALVYSGMPADELTFDSVYVVGLDTRLRNHEISSLVDIFKEDYWYPSIRSNLYRPLTTLGFWVEYCFLGYLEAPLGYQISNALLHFANALLVFVLAKKFRVSAGGALLAAVIYAVHPIATEAVANIVGRADLLASLGVFGGLVCYMTALEQTDWPRRLRWLVGCGACGLVGMLAKESAVVLPALVAWHGLLRCSELKQGGETRAAWLRDAGWAAALLAPTGVLFLVTRYIFSQTPGVVDHPFIDNPLMIEGFGVSKLTAFAVWGQQIAALFNPTGLSSDYSFNAIPVAELMFGNQTAIVGWVTLLGFAASFGFLLFTRKKLTDDPLYMAGAYVIAMLPTSNLLIKIGSIRADRFHYLPSALFWIFLFLLVERLPARTGQDARPATVGKRRGLAWTLVLGWVFCMAALAHVRCYDWRSNLNLWRSALVTTPGSGKVQAALGNELARVRNDEPNLREGIARAEAVLGMYKILRVPPEHWTYMIFSDVGAFSVSLYDQISKTPGREAEAGRILENGIKWMETGLSYEQLTRRRWARMWANNKLEEAPVYELLHRNYLAALHRQKRWVEAGERLDKLLKKIPFSAELLDLRAQNLHGQGRTQEAIDAWTFLALLRPDIKYYTNDLAAAIVELDKTARPLVPDETGALRLNLENEILIASLKRSWKTYDAILSARGQELERMQLRRAMRYHYGIKGDLS